MSFELLAFREPIRQRGDPLQQVVLTRLGKTKSKIKKLNYFLFSNVVIEFAFQ
jgi:hypothetical protein